MDTADQVNILVVDDEEIMRSLLCRILLRAGYQAIPASSGAEALRLIDQQRTDIVISDVKMPDINGFELLQRIKQSHPEIAVIMMTAYADTFTIKDALISGADEYITKPFKNYEVAVVVERAHWRLLSSRKQAENST